MGAQLGGDLHRNMVICTPPAGSAGGLSPSSSTGLLAGRMPSFSAGLTEADLGKQAWPPLPSRPSRNHKGKGRLTIRSAEVFKDQSGLFTPLRKAEAREGVLRGAPLTDADACLQAWHRGTVSSFSIPNRVSHQNEDIRGRAEPQTHCSLGRGPGVPVARNPGRHVRCWRGGGGRPPSAGITSGKATASRVQRQRQPRPPGGVRERPRPGTQRAVLIASL